MKNEVNEVNIEPIADKVYTQEETRLYPVKSIVFYDVDSLRSGEMFISASSLVPIRGLEENNIGYGSLYRVGKNIVFEGTIDYNSSERLLIETKSMTLYMGLLGKSEGLRYYANGVYVFSDKPLNPQFRPLGEIVL
jgi:hypothetical protein